MAGRVVVESVGVTQALLGLRARMARLDDLSVELEAAGHEVYRATATWFDSQGEGSWPPLADATVADKKRRGSASPETPLVDTGAMRESVISPNGPYSFVVRPSRNSIVLGVDWDVGGWQIPSVLAEGTANAGASHDVVIPARPIWPDNASPEAVAMRTNIAELLLRGI